MINANMIDPKIMAKFGMGNMARPKASGFMAGPGGMPGGPAGTGLDPNMMKSMLPQIMMSVLGGGGGGAMMGGAQSPMGTDIVGAGDGVNAPAMRREITPPRRFSRNQSDLVREALMRREAQA